MPQVSRYPLTEEIKERVFEVFWETVARLKTKERVERFLNDLLSLTEKTMLAKRLAIAILLTKGHDYRGISQVLKVSTATIRSINNWLKTSGEGYKMVIEKILKKEKTEELWDKLDEGLGKILLPPPGTNWKRIKSQERKRKRKSRIKRELL